MLIYFIKKELEYNNDFSFVMGYFQVYLLLLLQMAIILLKVYKNHSFALCSNFFRDILLLVFKAGFGIAILLPQPSN